MLTLISASPFFEGDEVTFYGRYTVADSLYFPHAISAAGDSVGTISSRGSVTVSNCGDAPCGFVARFHFPSAATSFIKALERLKMEDALWEKVRGQCVGRQRARQSRQEVRVLHSAAGGKRAYMVLLVLVAAGCQRADRAAVHICMRRSL